MRILFATDGSKGSLETARFLPCLGHHRNVHVHIITARDTEEPRDSFTILNSTQAALGDFAGHVTQASFEADSTSEIVDEILCTADYADADMIALGARGHSALARFLMGSVAEGVARYAHVPVLVGRLPEPAPEQAGALPLPINVVVGVDGSQNAHDAALFAANDFPLPHGSLLYLESVVQPPSWITSPDLLTSGNAGWVSDQTMANNTKYAEKVLSDLCLESEMQGHTVITETVYGYPTAELIHRAQIHHAELIVVGSRGVGGIDRFLLGSVSDRVLWHAPCSVLVCRRPPEL